MTAEDERAVGLRPLEVLGLVIGSLLLTPMLGGAMALHWKQTRPRAGRQAIGIALLLAGLLASVWFFWVFRT